jgi:arsenate reductase
LLRAQGVEFDTVEYLKTPLHRTTLEGIVAKLEGPPAELVRKDRRFEELGLKPANYVSAEAVVALLLKHPELMQRPVIVKGGKAVIAAARAARSSRLGRLAGGRRVPRLGAGSDLGHPAAADASRANQDSLDPAASRRAHFLQIGLPSALGLVVGVAYVIAD